MLHPHLSFHYSLQKGRLCSSIIKNMPTTKSWKCNRKGYKHTHTNGEGKLISIDVDGHVGYKLRSTNTQGEVGKEHQEPHSFHKDKKPVKTIQRI